MNQENLDEVQIQANIKKNNELKGKHAKYEGSARSNHTLERHSGTGRGKEIAKEGHGKGNWGNPLEEARVLEGISAEEALET